MLTTWLCFIAAANFALWGIVYMVDVIRDHTAWKVVGGGCCAFVSWMFVSVALTDIHSPHPTLQGSLLVVLQILAIGFILSLTGLEMYRRAFPKHKAP